MLKGRNPRDISEWHAIRREAALARNLLGSGVTALGRANYADKTGEYYTALFGLWVGLERLCKLILVADYAISHCGQMPDEGVVRQYGHNLIRLVNEADAVARRHNLTLDYPRPPTTISAKIIECVDAFADASRGRYANFLALGDPNLGKEEPIRKWWADVAELILKEHYYAKPAQERVEGRANAVNALISPSVSAFDFNETGDTMQDVLSASIRSGQTDIVQQYGRYYALTVIRWLAEVFSDLSKSACRAHNVDAFFGAWEHFQTYTVDDKLLKARKVWPLN